MAMSALFNIRTPPLFLKRYRFLLHFLFWIGLLVYDSIVWGMVDGAYLEKFVSSLIELPVKAAATYITLYYLIDRFLVQKRYRPFLLLLIISMIFFGVVLRIISYYILYPVYYPEGINMPLFFLPKILIAIFVTYSLVAIVASFHLMKHYYQHQQTTQLLEQTAQQLEKERLAAELKLLKSQINPHFLFNTLNNLYVLTLNHSNKAPLMVHKLSELMSYMLYDSNQAEVLLEKEIQYLKNYIDLEKIRYGDRLEVSLNIYGNPEGIMVAPLLMLPFVENSFKHGARNQLHGGWIYIDIEIQKHDLTLKVENSKPVSHDRSHIPSGIGLRNVKKRLDHLYGTRYTLQRFDEPDTHMAVLRINLNTSSLKPTISETTTML
jgi:two-component system, LytTR family, sensor kinase